MKSSSIIKSTAISMMISICPGIVIASTHYQKVSNNPTYSVSEAQNASSINNAPNNNRANMVMLPNNRFEKTYFYTDQQLAAEKALKKNQIKKAKLAK